MCLEITHVLQTLGGTAQQTLGGTAQRWASLVARLWPCLFFTQWLLCVFLFSLCVFLPSPHLVCWRKDFFWETLSISTNPRESERGLCSVWGAELKLERFLLNSRSVMDSGDPGKVLHLSCSCLLPSSEDKYLKGCEALGCDGCRGLRDLRPCTYDYSILMKLVCCGKYENLICKQWGLNATFISLLSVGNILLISLTMSEGQGWCCI